MRLNQRGAHWVSAESWWGAKTSHPPTHPQTVWPIKHQASHNTSAKGCGFPSVLNLPIKHTHLTSFWMPKQTDKYWTNFNLHFFAISECLSKFRMCDKHSGGDEVINGKGLIENISTDCVSAFSLLHLPTFAPPCLPFLLNILFKIEGWGKKLNSNLFCKKLDAEEVFQEQIQISYYSFLSALL